MEELLRTSHRSKPRRSEFIGHYECDIYQVAIELGNVLDEIEVIDQVQNSTRDSFTLEMRASTTDKYSSGASLIFKEKKHMKSTDREREGIIGAVHFFLVALIVAFLRLVEKSFILMRRDGAPAKSCSSHAFFGSSF